MNDNFDQKNDQWDEEEPVQITNLDPADSPLKRSAERWLIIISRAVATPRRRYGLAGFFLLILLGAIFLRLPRPTPTFSVSYSSTLVVAASPMITIVPDDSGTPSPIQVGTAEILPVLSLLAPAPTDCQVLPAPASKVFSSDWGGFAGGITLAGQGEVWFADTNTLGSTPSEILHLNDQGYTPWPGTQFIWEEGPNVQTPQPVTVQVLNQRTGQLSWWDLQSPQPGEQTLHLTKDGANSTGEPVPGWHEWVTDLLIQQAGCYTMTVSWPGGQWSLRFAAGR